ncbi:MAG: ammonium transporter [Clostridiaceae bacterium]|nr:ammonium transporter [Clostridiaceae bacterium]
MIDTGNTAFVLICAAMICFMTPGLAFFYGGMDRKKNALTIMMQSFIAMGVVTVVWFVCGFSLAFGGDVDGIIGNLQYAFLHGVGLAPNSTYAGTIPFLVFFLFQLMFAIITPALITGAFADRVSFKGYLIFLAAWTLLVYAPCAHWIWGGGFLQKMGAADFAGGIAIHCAAGMSALASVFFLGKRKFAPGEEIQPYSTTYIALGTGILWFGWFGFNGGSALAVNGTAAVAFVNTALGGAAAMVTWLAITWERTGHPSFVEALTGAVAGLATVTPASGYVAPWAAVLIGMAASIVCCSAVSFRKKNGWDDALDVWGVHGVGGMLGALLLGVFAQGAFGGVNGLIAGNPHQLLVQLVATAVVAAYSFAVTFLLLKVVNCITPVRVPEAEELAGLDQVFCEEA